MALLEEITYSPGEPIQDMYDKINAAIDKINSVLGSGTADQVIKKVSATDFNTQMVNSVLPLDGIGNIKITREQIGDWNMDTTSEKTVFVEGPLSTNVLDIFVSIRNDSGGLWKPLTKGGGVKNWVDDESLLITLERNASGEFDGDPAYDATSFNRGYVTVIYLS